jgi:hypothetical protein
LTINSSTPFAEALQLTVDVLIDSIGEADKDIDEFLVELLGDPNNISCGNAAAALAINFFQQSQRDPRMDLRHPSSPPVYTDRQVQSSADIFKMIAFKSSTGDKLRSTVGRLYHAGFVIPAARHSSEESVTSKNTPNRRWK